MLLCVCVLCFVCSIKIINFVISSLGVKKADDYDVEALERAMSDGEKNRLALNYRFSSRKAARTEHGK